MPRRELKNSPEGQVQARRQEPGGAGGEAWQAPDHYFEGTISDNVQLCQLDLAGLNFLPRRN